MAYQAFCLGDFRTNSGADLMLLSVNLRRSRISCGESLSEGLSRSGWLKGMSVEDFLVY